MYKLTKPIFQGIEAESVQRLSDSAFIPLSLGNTDYANFKEQILAGEAELQDAEGNVMSSEAAQTFVRGLP